MNLSEMLDKLLDECTAPSLPDYYTFYGEVHRIMSSGVPPRTFCEVFAAKVKEYDNRMETYSERGLQGEKLSDEELRVFKEVFHRWKLLNGCAEKLPLTMRKLISELAGCAIM